MDLLESMWEHCAGGCMGRSGDGSGFRCVGAAGSTRDGCSERAAGAVCTGAGNEWCWSIGSGGDGWCGECTSRRCRVISSMIEGLLQNHQQLHQTQTLPIRITLIGACALVFRSRKASVSYRAAGATNVHVLQTHCAGSNGLHELSWCVAASPVDMKIAELASSHTKLVLVCSRKICHLQDKHPPHYMAHTPQHNIILILSGSTIQQLSL